MYTLANKKGAHVMQRFVFFLLLWIFGIVMARAEQPTASPTGDSAPSTFAIFDPIGTNQYHLNTTAVRQLLSNSDSLVNIPLRWNQSEVILQVHSFELLSPTALLLSTGYGRDSLLPIPRHRAFWGRILNTPQSFAHLLVFDNEIFGFIELPGTIPQRFSFQPDSATKSYYLASEPNSDRDLWCTTDELPQPPMRTYQRGQQMWSQTIYVADLAIECDVRYYNFMGQKLGRAVRYAFALVAAVSAIYQRDLRCRLRINFLRVWTHTGPYSGTNTATLLTQLRSYWNANMTTVRRTLTHLLVRANIGGRAYIDKLCNDNFNYGVSGIFATFNYPISTYSWDAFVMAHELGHNFGAYHTHECLWNPPIDSCAVSSGGCISSTVSRPGTIMSYCSTRSLFFHPVVAGYLRSIIEQTPCLSSVGDAQPHDLSVLAMLQPVAGATYATTAAFSPQVAIRNLGNTVETSLTVTFSITDSAGTTIYSSSHQITTLGATSTATVSFTQFSTTTAGMYSAKSTVTNASLDPVPSNNELTLPFAISSAPLTGSLTILAPTTATTYTAGDNLIISFTASGITEVSIEWSPNDGKTWELIKYRVNTGTGTVNFGWTIPPHPTQQARIRIVALDNPSVSTTSVLFGITVPVDIEVTELVSPAPWTVISGCFAPEFTIRNAGDSTITSIPYRYTIVDRMTWDTVYVHQDTALLTIPPGITHTLALPPASLTSTHQYSCFARVLHPDDAQPQNDSLTGAFFVTAPTTVEFTLDSSNTANSQYGFPAPYGYYQSYGSKHQMLIRREELPVPHTFFLTGIAFRVVSVGSSPNTNWSIKIARTLDTALSTSFLPQSDFVTVTSLSTYTPHFGWNTHIFSTPYPVPRDSNIVIQTCFQNANLGVVNTRTLMKNKNFAATISAASTSNVCQLSTGTQMNHRPTMRFQFRFPPTLISPNGYEILYAGTQHRIQWSTNCSASPVTIHFSADGGQTWSTIASATSNTGSFWWTVPSVLTTTALLRIAFADQPAIQDFSNNFFTILSTTPSLTLFQPNGGEQWQVGLTYAITWNSVNVTTISIAYSTNGSTTWIPITTAAASSSSFQWTIPNTPTTAAIVRISDSDNNNIYDQSDAPFTILPIFPPTTLTATAGNAIVILHWQSSTSSGISGYAVYRRITTHTIFTQIGSTTLTTYADAMVTNGTTYEYAVRTMVGTFLSDFSPTTQATPQMPTLTLLIPTSGSVLWSGSTTPIQWSWSGNIPSVSLQWRPYPNTPWQSVTTNIANTGAYTWYVPDFPTTSASLRIVKADDATISDELDHFFTIYSTSQTALHLKFLLEGPATSSGTMRTELTAYIPTSQPYNNASYQYDGTEQWSSSATGVVDWILIRIRSSTDASILIATTAALLRYDGIVLDETGFPQALVPTTILPPGNYFMSIHHRNHIPILSSTSVTVTIGNSPLFDFTSTATLFSTFASPAATIATGQAAAYGGDVVNDGIINAKDRTHVREQLFATGYVASDATLDGVVNAEDRSLIRNNSFVITQIP